MIGAAQGALTTKTDRVIVPAGWIVSLEKPLSDIEAGWSQASTRENAFQSRMSAKLLLLMRILLVVKLTICIVTTPPARRSASRGLLPHHGGRFAPPVPGGMIRLQVNFSVTGLGVCLAYGGSHSLTSKAPHYSFDILHQGHLSVRVLEGPRGSSPSASFLHELASLLCS